MFTYRSGILDFRVAVQCLLDFTNVADVSPTPEVCAVTVLLLSMVGN